MIPAYPVDRHAIIGNGGKFAPASNKYFGLMAEF